MLSEETAFPRGKPSSFGGGKRRRMKLIKPIRIKAADRVDDLFKPRNRQASFALEQKKKRKQQQQQQGDDGEKRQRNSSDKPEALLRATKAPVGCQMLQLTDLTPGMTLLGSVCEIFDYRVIVSLPGNLRGFISISEICDAYNSELQAYAANAASTAAPPALQNIFHIGQLLCCQVLDRTVSDTKRKSKRLGSSKNNKAGQDDTITRERLDMTVNPRLVNSEVSEKSLVEGMILPGAVVSVEEKGYLIDVGSPIFKAFVNFSDTTQFEQQFNSGNRLSLFQVLPFIVSEIKPGFIGLQLNSIIKKNELESIPMRSIFPGLVLNFHVLEVRRNGLVLQRSSPNASDNVGAMLATAHWRHLPSPPDAYKVGSVVSATVLYVDPLTKSICVSLARHLRRLNAYDAASLIPAKAVGQVFDDAKVLRIDGKRAVVFDVTNCDTCSSKEPLLFTRAFAKRKDLADDKNKQDAIDDRNFAVDSRHRCRIIGVSYIDGCYVVSLKPSVLDNKFQSLASISPGTRIAVVVEGPVNGGLRVHLDQAKFIGGFIPWTLATDSATPQQHDREQFELLQKRFPAGSKLKCRVMTVDSERRRLILTAKTRMVKSKHPKTLFTDLKTIVAGESCCEGYIMKFVDDGKGILVGFYGGVVGFLPKSRLPQYCRSSGANLQALFHPGQVITCRAREVDLERPGLILEMVENDNIKEDSIKEEGEELAQLKETKENRRPLLEIGEIHRCKVVSKRVDAGNEQNGAFQVSIDKQLGEGQSEKIIATLPFDHLSDFPDNSLLLSKTIEPDRSIEFENVVVVANRGRLIVSRKASLVEQAQKGGSPQLGEILYGWVVNVLEYGIFVAFPGNFVGLVPKKYLADRFVVNPTSLFRRGQTVVAKIVENDKKRRCIASLRLRDVKSTIPEDGCGLLSTYFQERQLACEISPISSQKLDVGKVFGMTVTKIEKNEEVFGEICFKNLKIPAKIPKELVPASFRHSSTLHRGFPTIGNEIDVVVVFHDLLNDFVEVSANTRLISDIKTKLENPVLPVLPGQLVQSEVQLVRSAVCTVVSLNDHATGRFAVVPAKRHLNDVSEPFQFVQGQTNPVSVKETSFSNKEFSLAVFKIHLKKAKNMSESPSKSSLTAANSQTVPSSVLVTGSVVNAEIVNFTSTVLNLKVEDGKFRGRVHITETLATKAGDQPFADIMKGQKVRVRVLGLHHRAHQKQTARAKLYECSLIVDPSSSNQPKRRPLGEADVFEGQLVPIFVKDYRHQYATVEFSRLITRPARIHRLNMATDSAEVSKITEKFPAGSFLGNGLVIRTSPEVEFSLVGKPLAVEPERVFNGIVFGKSAAIGLQVGFADGSLGHVALTDISDDFTSFPAKAVKANSVLPCFLINRLGDGSWAVSTRKSRVVKSEEAENNEEKSKFDLEIDSAADLVINDVVRGFVVACKEHSGVFVRLGRSVVGRASFEMSSEYFLVSPEKFFQPGLMVSAKILSIDYQNPSRHVEISLLANDTGVDLQIPKALTRGKRKNLGQGRKRTRNDSTSSVSSSSSKDSSAKKANLALDASLPSPGFDFSQADVVQPPLTAGNEQGSDEDGGLEERSKSGRKESARERENRTFSLEMARLRGADDPESAEPQTADDFDRLAIEKPNSSLVWSRYVAFHLASLDVAKAREVAERALKSVSFREEAERLNVWVAYFNLENLFGSDESLREVVRRACQEADALSVYERLIDVYIQSSKIENAEHQLSLLTRKFRENPSVWLRQGEFYFTQGKVDHARGVLTKALDALDNRHHVDLIVKFALLEMSPGGPGDLERGRSLFEKVLTNYPRRLDVWNVYVDALVKKGDDLAGARRLFERMVSLKLPYNKARLIFRRFAAFERSHGDAESMAHVEELATKYLQQSPNSGTTNTKS